MGSLGSTTRLSAGPTATSMVWSISFVAPLKPCSTSNTPAPSPRQKNLAKEPMANAFAVNSNDQPDEPWETAPEEALPRLGSAESATELAELGPTVALRST